MACTTCSAVLEEALSEVLRHFVFYSTLTLLQNQANELRTDWIGLNKLFMTRSVG